MRPVRFVLPAIVILFCPSVVLAASPLQITRVAAYPASDHEWVEVQNVSETDVDLTGWKFWEDNINHGISAFQGTLTLPAGDTAIIADRADFFVADHPEYTGTVLDSSWSTFTLTGEPVGLRDPLGALYEFPEQVWMAEAPAIVFPVIEPTPVDPAPEPPIDVVPPETASSTEPSILPEVVPTTDLEVAPEPVTTSTPIMEAVPLEPEQTTPPELPTEEMVVPIMDTSTSTVNTDVRVEDVQPVPESTTPTSTPVADLPSETVATSTPIAEIATPAPPPSPHVLRLSEALPAPIEEHEWVEISNPTSDVIELDGLKLHDSVGTIATLTGSIPAHGYVVITLTTARLNNGGDSIRLVDHEGTAIDEVRYGDDALPAPEKGTVIARDENGWHISTMPTPGNANVITPPPTPDEPPEEVADDAPIQDTPRIVPTSPPASSTPRAPVPKKPKATTPAPKPVVRASTPTSSKKTTVKVAAATKTATKKTTTTKTTTVYHRATIADLMAMNDGWKVILEGTVVGSDPSSSGKRWYLQDGTAGVLISVTGKVPLLKTGSRVTVRGTTAWSSGPTVKTTFADITAGETSATTTPYTTSAASLGPQDGNRYVTISGLVTSVRGSRITLTDDTFETTVVLPTGMQAPGKGVALEVRGIYQASDPPALLLLARTDIVTREMPPTAAAPTPQAGQTNKRSSPWPMTVAFGGLAAIGTGVVRTLRKKDKGGDLHSRDEPEPPAWPPQEEVTHRFL